MNVMYTIPIWQQRSKTMYGAFLLNVKIPVSQNRTKRMSEGFLSRRELQRRGPGFIYPNKVYTGQQTEISVAGLQITLMNIPGETQDMTGVWLKKDKVFTCGDDLYEAFPNIGSIRGAPARSTTSWIEYLDRILVLKPEVLIMGHLKPLRNGPDIKSALIAHRDALQFVHDQTVRHMNKGLLPTEVAAIVKMPPQLASHPFLKERYGTVNWAVKGVLDAYMGWFSGDPVDLSPFTPDEEAWRMVELGGGMAKTVRKAKEAARKEDHQWALVLSSSVLRVRPRHSQARHIKADAMTKLAQKQTSDNGILYYKSSAAETLGEIDTTTTPEVIAQFLSQASMWDLFQSLTVYFKPEECQEMITSVFFKIKRKPTLFIKLVFRNGVVVVSKGKTNGAAVDVVCSEAQCRQFVINLILGTATTPLYGFPETSLKCFGL